MDSQDSMDAKDVFISYSTKNTDLAKLFCSQLEGVGVQCWIAPRDIQSADKWAGAIVKGIQDSKLTVLLVSEGSVASEEVEKEVNLVNSFRKPIIPMRIEPAELKGAFLYHLSNKQWVDALSDDKFTRFEPAIDAVLSHVGKPSIIERGVVPGSILDLARNLVRSLNEKHIHKLLSINASFSLREEGQDQIKVIFPIIFGATGLNLIFSFDGIKKTMEFYADAVSDGDPLKEPFINFIKTSFKNEFPSQEAVVRGRKWKFFKIVPETPLTMPLVDHPVEKCFEFFCENVYAFSEKVFPRVFEWIEYGIFAGAVISKLETRLREIFPEKDGWCVGAAEGSRLSHFRMDGGINVYKKHWVPQDNYKSRGLLSITLHTDWSLLKNLYIGIYKYEDWLDLGEWKDRLIEACNNADSKTRTSADLWPWWVYLDEPWKSSGISENEFNWKENPDGFINYCVAKFEALKTVEGILDGACAAIPSLQVIEFEELRTSQREPETLLAFNWMNYIKEETQKIITSKFGETGIGIECQFRGKSWDIGTIFARIKINNFDAAAAFICNQKEIKTEFISMDPPDFEVPIIKDFFTKRYSDTFFKNRKLTESNAYGGASISDWMLKYQAFIAKELDDVIPGLLSLMKHLIKVAELTKSVERELLSALPSEEGWFISNEASQLDRTDGIIIYHQHWLINDLNHNDRPLAVIQLLPESECFDDLHIAIKWGDQVIPEIEKILIMICGACEFAFGSSDIQSSEYLWCKKFDAPYDKTGGRWFGKELLSGAGESSFLDYISKISEKLKKIEPLVTKTCNEHNKYKKK